MVSVAETRQASGLRRLALSPTGLIVALTGIAGVVLRIWTYQSPLTIPNSDEALIGLMVRHFAHGQFTTFFWGRPYGGTQEVLLAVPGFILFGSSYLALRVVPIALSAVATLLIWRIGRRTLGEPAALAAAGLFWVWPAFDFLQFVRAQGFYASGATYGALLVLLGLRVVEQPDRRRVGVFGLVLGLAFWQSAQVVPIALVVVGWVIWRAPRALRHAWLAACLAIVGALPWLVWNVQHNFASLSQNPGLRTYERSLRLLLSPLLPMELGFRAPYTATLLIPSTAITWLLYLTLLAAFLYSGRRVWGRPVELLYLVVAIFPFLYALPRKTSFISFYPQYLTILTPLLALLLARVATTQLRAAGLILAGCLITAISLHRMEPWLSIRQPVPTTPASYAPLISTLERLHLDRLYADYWIAYRVDFDTREQIIAVENQFSEVRFVDHQLTPSDDPEVRYAPYQTEVRAARHGFVFWRQGLSSIAIVPALRRHHYQRVDVGPWVVYAPPPLR